MDRMLFLAMNAAKQTLVAQALVTNNLANTSTTGFRADFEAQRAMPVFGDGLGSRVYSMTERPGINFTQGPLQTTDNPLDIAIKGDGFIAVQDANGKEAYTRAGNLHVGPNGLLMTGAGDPVMGEGGPLIVPAAQTYMIGADGTVSIRPSGQQANALAIVDRIKLVNPPVADLKKGEDGLFRTTSGEPVTPTGDVRIEQGAIEGSNVSSVGEMVRMIELQRNYELQIKAMHTADSNESRLSDAMHFG